MDLPGVLARCPHVLLDFDGPMCSVFSAITSTEAADMLASRLRDAGTEVPVDVRAQADPFAVLHYVAAHAPHLVQSTERALTRLELAGVVSATPTPSLRATLDALLDCGHTVTVVSNYSAQTVDSFLRAQSLHAHIQVVAARTDPNPRLLKPNPHLLLRAAAELGVPPDGCVLIGDSRTDIAAAHRGGAASIALAATPEQRELLAAVRPDAVINELSEVIDALRQGNVVHG